jgi:E3 ubiquitin-protein ligase EDD1
MKHEPLNLILFLLLQVTFLNEPGEGSGVARGFYTALAEAVLTNTRLPNLDLAQAVASGSTASLTAAASKSMQFSLIQRLRGTRDPSRLGRSSSSTSGSKSSSSRTAREISRLSFDARSFVMNGKFQMIFPINFQVLLFIYSSDMICHTLLID